MSVVYFASGSNRPADIRGFAAVALIAAGSPGCVVSLDSNLIAANVGRGVKPRKLTVARDRAARLLAGGLTGFLSAQELGIVLAFGSPELVTAVTFRACIPRALKLASVLAPEFVVRVDAVQVHVAA